MLNEFNKGLKILRVLDGEELESKNRQGETFRKLQWVLIERGRINKSRVKMIK